MAERNTDEVIDGVKEVLNNFFDELKVAFKDVSDKLSKTVDVWTEAPAEPTKVRKSKPTARKTNSADKVTPIRKTKKKD